MRSEQQMMELIVSTAQDDDRIRGAYLTGSRTNPRAPKDMFQDYDVMYLVHETQPFQADKAWIDRFGERLYMQYPEDGAYFSGCPEKCYGWLMQFRDGNRLDLHVCTPDYLPHSLEEDKIYRVLVDKDGLLPKCDTDSDQPFWVQPFTQEQFSCTCNEFWWCMNNVAKGLWRDEGLYVLDMLNANIRPMLTRMLEFKIGMENNFSVSVGKCAKYMRTWLPETMWNQYLATFSTAENHRIWESVFIMCQLFDTTARQVADQSGYVYDEIEAENSWGYLNHVQALPPDAHVIY